MAPLQNDVETLVTGMENMAIAAAPAYWTSEECLTKLDQSFVTRRCLERWAGMHPFPNDLPELSVTMQATRNFFLVLLQRGNANTFHNSWAKACALFDVTMQALWKKNSALLDDVVLVTTVVLGIARKDETSAASGCYGDLLQVAAMFEDQLGRPRKMRTVKELKDTEFEIFAALEWTLPQTDTYTCISAILLRMDILTRGEHKPQLETAWQHAVQKCVRAVMFGLATGYATAYHIVRDSLEDVGFEQAFLDPLMHEAAPEPLKAINLPFLPPLRSA
jgi:hypothetical protein